MQTHYIAIFFRTDLSWDDTRLNQGLQKNCGKSLLKYFDTTVVSKIKCDRFTVVDLDKQSGGRYFYKENRNKRLSFSTITFRYSLFDNALNTDFRFYISVDKNHQIISDSSIVKTVPICIRTGQKCHLISADSAKKISIADSIKYANHLSCQLRRNKIDNEYYWIVTGHEHSDRPKTKGAIWGIYAEAISSVQERIINTLTGQIVSHKQFDGDW